MLFNLRTDQLVKILYSVSFADTAQAFLKGQMKFVANHGHEVHLLAPDPSGELVELCNSEQATFHNITIERNPNLVKDAKALLSTMKCIATIRPDIVIAGTPKASLLSLLASVILGTKVRIYLCHGLRHEGLSGLAESLFKLIELFLCTLATDVVAVSNSVQDGLFELGASPNKVTVLGSGSANGIDTEKFKPISEEKKTGIRSQLGLEQDALVVIFVGRLTRDKGLSHLQHLAINSEDISLLIVGQPEPSDQHDKKLIRDLRAAPNTHFLGPRIDIPLLIGASDILVLPTKREGLPTVLIEASSCGIPVVAMRATGTVDAIIDGHTGHLSPQGDSEEFSRLVNQLKSSPSDRVRLGKAGRHYIVQNFEQQFVWKSWLNYIENRKYL